MARDRTAEDTLGACLNAFFEEQKLDSGNRPAYTAHIQDYAQVLRERGVLYFAAAGVPDANAFIKHLRQKRRPDGAPLSPATISRRLASVSSFYQYLIRVDRCQRNPMRGAHRPKTPVRQPPQPLTAEDVDRLLNAPQGDTFMSSRDRAVLETLYSVGVTVSELRALDVGDIDVVEEWVKVRGRRQRVIPMGLFALQAIKAYLPLRASVEHQREPSDQPLFINRSGGRISARGIRNVFERYRGGLGIPDVSLRVLRASFANHLVARGANLRMVQEMLGHKCLFTTKQILGVASTA